MGFEGIDLAAGGPLLLQQSPNDNNTIWGGLPNLANLMGGLLNWARAAVPVIAAIIIVWSIYESWTQNPDRFSWFAALFRALGVGLVAVVAWNAQSIVQWFVNSAPQQQNPPQP